MFWNIFNIRVDDLKTKVNDEKKGYLDNEVEWDLKIPRAYITNVDGENGAVRHGGLDENGNVQATGSHFIGARHFQFVPGSYQMRSFSKYGKALLENFGIEKTVGETFSKKERTQLIGFYIKALEAIVQNNQGFFAFEKELSNNQVDKKSDALYGPTYQYLLSAKAIDSSTRIKQIAAHQEFWHSWKTFHPNTSTY